VFKQFHRSSYNFFTNSNNAGILKLGLQGLP
jgi:hypothetical protein